MIHRLMILCLLFLLSGCSTPNLWVASHINKDYKFRKKEKIIITLDNNHTEKEKEYFQILARVMEENGFQIVDSIKYADRMLMLNVFDSVKSSNTSSISQQSAVRMKNGKPEFVPYGGTSIKSAEEYHTMLKLKMVDLTQYRVDKQMPLMWEAVLSSPHEKISNNPEIAFSVLLKQYGKNKVYNGKFPKR